MCLCLSSVAAQDRISGHVWNRTDGPVMMANVVELDQNNRIVEATTTDINGNFSMPIKNRKDRLQISYVGYQTHTQVIGDSKVFRIEMRSVGCYPDPEHGRNERSLVRDGRPGSAGTDCRFGHCDEFR